MKEKNCKTPLTRVVYILIQLVYNIT